jgi:hypothetical protein
VPYGEALPPLTTDAPGGEYFSDSDEVRRRKDEYEKLKELPGMDQVLRARDYLNALAFERGEAGPTDKELQEYLSWSDANRLPIEKGGRERSAERRDTDRDGEEQKSGGGDAGERAPNRDMADAIGGGGLAVIGKIADSLETLFDERPVQQIERDERIMGEKRTIEQITEQQQRQQEAEADKWRQVELELYLAQRDRERHIDRGR